MKYFYFLITILSISLIGCKPDEQSQQKKEVKSKTAEMNFSRFRGHWIDRNFYQQVKESRTLPPNSKLPTILELVFTSEYNDSIWIVTPKNAIKSKITSITPDSISFANGGISYDNTTGVEVLIWVDKNAKSQIFERAGEAEATMLYNAPSILPTVLQQHTITGDYFLRDEKGKKTEDFVFFRKDGAVVGLEDYKSYKLCYLNDCSDKPNSEKPVVYLNKEHGGDFFEWEFKDYDKENEKEENKGKKPKKFGMSLKLHKLTAGSSSKSKEKKDSDAPTKGDYELSVQKLG